MGLIARLSRIVPLVILLAVVAAIIYLVVTYRHSPARAKEVLIQVFTWVCGVLSALFGVASVYAFFDNAELHGRGPGGPGHHAPVQPSLSEA